MEPVSNLVINSIEELIEEDCVIELNEGQANKCMDLGD